MRKRGRVSAAAIGVTPVGISAKERPAPPTGLTARERRQWNEITGALRPDWFEAENLPLLAESVRTAELCTRLARASQSRGLRPALRRAIAAEDGGDQHAGAIGDQVAAYDSVVNDDAYHQSQWRLGLPKPWRALRATRRPLWRAFRLQLGCVNSTGYSSQAAYA
jgi:hypothetical protein